MSSAYKIVPCTLSHLREIARTMRPEDRFEIEAVDQTVRHVLVDLWRNSVQPLAAIIDGEVAAVWGDNAPLLTDRGAAWLFTSPAIERIPLAYFREVRAYLQGALQWRNSLHAYVACDYERALRFFAMLGFRIGPPVQAGMTFYREIVIERPH